ncbi:MAG: Rdx family protein [Chloroflexi bacterium]|nr:Rdx family protein [Chloroflexota bacterium]
MSEREIEAFIGSWKLIPATGGRFEVTVNGELVFSKKALGRHANPGEIHDLLVTKLNAVRPPGLIVTNDDE